MANKSKRAQCMDASDECRNIAGDLESLVTLAELHGIPSTGLESARRELDWSARQFRNAVSETVSTNEEK